MSKIKKKAYIGTECVACGRCLQECPFEALTIDKGCTAKVDEHKCIGCGKCAKVCPAGVIEIAGTEVQTA